jgi:uncharacterized protein
MRSDPLAAWTRMVRKRPRLVLLCSLALALAALLLAGKRLHFSSDRSRLLDQRGGGGAAFGRYRDEFPGARELIILVHSADPALRASAVQSLATELLRSGQYQDVTAALHLPELPAQGLFFLSDERLDRMLEDVSKQQGWTGWEDTSALSPTLKETLQEALRSGGRSAYRSPWGPAPPSLATDVPLQLAPDTQALVGTAQRQDDPAALEPVLQQIKQRHPGVRFALAGDFAVARTDARRALWSAAQAGLIALFLVHVFFRLAWGRSGPPRIALATVLVGLAWSLGWAALCCPQLNVVTVNFAAALIGVGMDFNINLLYRLEESQHQEALPATAKENLVGALATACAFGALTLTPFQAVAQLGTLSSGGVLLCWCASVTVLPALLALGAGGGSLDPAHRRWSWLAAVEQRWSARPGAVLGAALAATLVFAYGTTRLRFDGNLLHILPRDSAAAAAESAFHRWCGYCPFFAVSLAGDEATLRSRTRQFAALARVESAALWWPATDAGHLARVAAVVEAARRLPALPPPPPAPDAAQLLRLRAEWSGKLGVATLGPGPVQAGLHSFYQSLHADLKQRLDWLEAQRAKPPALSDLPDAWRRRYQSSAGTYLLKVYAREDLWEPAACRAFLHKLRTVDPHITGQPVATLAYLDQLQSSFEAAARNALAAIFLLLWVMLRSARLAVLALLPKLVATVWMLGALGWLGLPLNPVNATALPVTLGIGLVFGVHVLHDWLKTPGRPIFGGSTGAAVAASGLSTLLGYLALVTVAHRGMVSLGIAMAVGLAANLVVALVVFPVALRWWRK